jgi:hypothetical protein
MTYKLVNSVFTGEAAFVKRLADNAVIPFDPANTDYQAYLRWCEEGNVPLSADELVAD